MSLVVVNKVDVAEGEKVSRKLLQSWPLSLTTTTTSTKREACRGNMIKEPVQASHPRLNSSHLTNPWTHPTATPKAQAIVNFHSHPFPSYSYRLCDYRRTPVSSRTNRQRRALT